MSYVALHWMSLLFIQYISIDLLSNIQPHLLQSLIFSFLLSFPVLILSFMYMYINSFPSHNFDMNITSSNKLAFQYSNTFIQPKFTNNSTYICTMSLKQKTAVVTGGTRGIGRGLAIGLGERGAHVIITGRTKNGPGSLEEAAELVRAAGGTCTPHVVDHGDDNAIREWFDTLQAELARENRTLDIFVNNAYTGVNFLNESHDIPFWKKSANNPSVPDDTSDPGKVWDIINGVGLRNNWICSTYAMRIMEKMKTDAFLVNITSWGGLVSIFDTVYGIGKSGIERMSAELATEAPENVHCFALSPGYVATEALKEQAEKSKGTDKDEFPEWNAETPLFVGRVLGAMIGEGDSKLYKSYRGRVIVTAEIANRFRVNDENDFRALSFRSFRFTAMNAVPFLRQSMIRYLIPRWLNAPWPIVREMTAAVKFWNY